MGTGSLANQIVVSFFNEQIFNNECSRIKLNSTLGRFSVSVNNTEYFNQTVVAFEEALLMTFWGSDCAVNTYEPCQLKSPRKARMFENIYQVNVTGLCNASIPVTSKAITTTASTTTQTYQQPVIVAPNPPPKPNDCNSSNVIESYCKLVDAKNDTDIQKAVVNARNAFVDSDNITSDDVYYAGATAFKATQSATAIDEKTATDILDIINHAAGLNITMLKEVNDINEGSVLWFPDTLKNIVAKSNFSIKYNDSDSDLYISSLNKTDLCDGSSEYHEACFSGSERVSSTSEGISFCIQLPLKNGWCNSKVEKGFISITPVKFYIFGRNSTEDQVNFVNNSDNDDDIPTVDNAGECNSQPVTMGHPIPGAVGVDNDANLELYSVKMIVHHQKNENNLHRIPTIGVFAGQNFRKDSQMTHGDGQYEGYFKGSNSIVYYEGNSSEPILCSSLLKTIMFIFAAASSVFVLFSFVAFFVKRPVSPPCCIRWLSILFYNFHDERLNSKVQLFSAFYNLAFFIFLITISILGNTNVIQSETWCEILAGFNHYMFLVCVIFSILKVFVVTEAVGNWKYWYRTTIWILAGSEATMMWPLIHGLLWPFIITGVFGLRAKEFFQRNDGFCWIRPDYQFAALWMPLTLLVLTFPFYIPLIFESTTLYVTYLSKWHILYVIFVVCHLFLFIGIAFVFYFRPRKIKKTVPNEQPDNPLPPANADPDNGETHSDHESGNQSEGAGENTHENHPPHSGINTPQSRSEYENQESNQDEHRDNLPPFNPYVNEDFVQSMRMNEGLAGSAHNYSSSFERTLPGGCQTSDSQSSGISLSKLLASADVQFTNQQPEPNSPGPSSQATGGYVNIDLITSGQFGTIREPQNPPPLHKRIR
ncbi:hypothetical protein FO519_001341 [Halicephalobus sp. NKZ332]|nr:hypothetical protein FO519_001341 [Halicephalobus sp. NKZ332]